MRVSAGTLDREKIRSRKILGWAKRVEELQNSGPKKEEDMGTYKTAVHVRQEMSTLHLDIHACTYGFTRPDTPDNAHT